MTIPQQVRRAAADEGDEHSAPSAGPSHYFTNDFVDCLGSGDTPAIDGTAAQPSDSGGEPGSAGASRG